MKQTRFLLLAVLCLLVASVAKADDTPIPVGQLPAAAKTFVQANFPLSMPRRTGTHTSVG